MSLRKDLTENDGYSDQEFTGNLDVRFRTGKKVSRRRFIQLLGLEAAGLVIAACAPVLQPVETSTPAPTSSLTPPTDPDAAKVITAIAELNHPTAVVRKPTETPRSTDVPVKIAEVEPLNAAKTDALLSQLQKNPTVWELTSGSDLKHNERKQLVDKDGRVDRGMQLVPALEIFRTVTENGKEQIIFLVRHPKQDQSTGEIIQQKYLITGQKNNTYVDPTQVEPQDLKVVPITEQSGIWTIPDPADSTVKKEFAKLALISVLTSPYGGTVDFNLDDIKFARFLGVLDFAHHPFLPLDKLHELTDGTHASLEHPVLGDSESVVISESTNTAGQKIVKSYFRKPWLTDPDFLKGGFLARNLEYYLTYEHPEFVKEILSQETQIDFELKTSPLKRKYVANKNPKFTSPIFRLQYFSSASDFMPNFSAINAFMEVVRDNSPRGWGILNFADIPMEPTYAFNSKLKPVSFICFLKDTEPLVSAANTLATTGVIPEIFSREFLLQGIPN